MTSRERIALTMRHQAPDRVPVMCQLSIGHMNLNAGYKPHEIWFEPDAFADATIKLARRYAFDGVLVVLPGRPPNYLSNLHSLSEDAEGQHLNLSNGDRFFLPWDDMPHYLPADATKPARADFDAFDPDRDILNIDNFPGYLWNFNYHLPDLREKDYPGPLQPSRIPAYTFTPFDAVRAACPDLSVHASIYSPLTQFFELFGYEHALTGFMTDPAKAHSILSLLTEGVIAYGLGFLEHGADAIDHSSAFVGAPFLSRRMYREFVVPYEQRVNQALRDAGGIVYTHTCGSIGDRLDLMRDTATCGIDTLDPPPLGNGDLAQAKRDFGRDLFFKGNMNSVALLNFKTEAEVLEMASRTLAAGKPGAGDILSTACSVAPRVEPWKLKLLAPLVDREGRY